MKSYTDLEQSKKLAKILPLESADMLWGYWYNGENHCVPNMRPFRDLRDNIPNGYIPAWSLAALLDNLPYPSLAQHANELWSLTAWVDTVQPYSVGGYDNKIDACVDMIIKLYEQKLL